MVGSQMTCETKILLRIFHGILNFAEYFKLFMINGILSSQEEEQRTICTDRNQTEYVAFVNFIHLLGVIRSIQIYFDAVCYLTATHTNVQFKFPFTTGFLLSTKNQTGFALNGLVSQGSIQAAKWPSKSSSSWTVTPVPYMNFLTFINQQISLRHL